MGAFQVVEQFTLEIMEVSKGVKLLVVTSFCVS
jgi:hypothetical protein